MFRKASILFVITMFVSTAIFSNTAIFSKHSGKIKDGKKINCDYCHKDAGIKKEKGQFKDGLVNGKKRSDMKTCNGSGCHTR